MFKGLVPLGITKSTTYPMLTTTYMTVKENITLNKLIKALIQSFIFFLKISHYNLRLGYQQIHMKL